MMENVLTVTEVAKLLRISKWSLYELVKRNEVPHLRLGKTIRFDRQRIESFIKN